MRLLIGIYLALGIINVVGSSAIGLLTIWSWSFPRPGRTHQNGFLEEGLVIAALGFLLASPHLLAAYGLWKRWRLVRLVLIGISWWTLGVSAFIIGVTLAELAGLTNGRILGTAEPPSIRVAMAFGLAIFGGWQWWVLMRPSVRQSFEKSAKLP